MMALVSMLWVECLLLLNTPCAIGHTPTIREHLLQINECPTPIKRKGVYKVSYMMLT